MSLTLTLSRDYGYVILATASTFVMGALHGINSGSKRKACGDMPLPLVYATAEQNAKSPAHMAFSCAQRAHANFIENQPTAIAALLISGLHFPRVAAGLGFAWTIARYVYMKGYSDASKGPNGKGRLKGFFLAFVAQNGLIVMSIYSGLKITGLL